MYITACPPGRLIGSIMRFLDGGHDMLLKLNVGQRSAAPSPLGRIDFNELITVVTSLVNRDSTTMF